ncbi:MAG: dTMP kinase [Synergistaceae bacterium]|jgi:dTMP kinase|nr:dTMP kinase [Synergistaceae bacterium]
MIESMGTERGFFITIEGIDGCGKSTQAQRLSALLEETGKGVLRTFEPGGWRGGALLRELLLSDVSIGTRTELLLFLADRSGHLESEILPALARGQQVICERYTDSTLAYQSWGRGLPFQDVDELLKWCRFPPPDLTILLDIDAGTSLTRLKGRGSPDRIEADGEAFMARVAEGYRELAKRCPGRIVTVDALRDVEEVTAQIWKCVEMRRGTIGEP